MFDTTGILSILGVVAPIALLIFAKKRHVTIQPIGLILVVMFGVWCGFKSLVHFGVLSGSKAFQVLTMEHIDVPQGVVTSGESRSMARTREAVRAANVPAIRNDGYAWNSQLAQMGAIGGKETRSGGMMAKYGVKVVFTRVNSNNTLQSDAMAFAKALKGGQAHPTVGAHIIQMMGDGTAPFLYSLNRQIKSELGWEYRYVIIGSAGQSFGEDKWMVPCEWVKDCSAQRPELKDIKLVKGQVVITVPQDGDMNIVLKWASDNGVCFNPDPNTLDLECINVHPAQDNDYMQAAMQFTAGVETTRKVTRFGKPAKDPETGKDEKTVRVRMVSTWTPGDSYVFERMPNMVSLADTQLYSGQMPNAIMICNKWAQQNPDTVKAYLSAIYENGDRVKRDPKALMEAANASAAAYNDKNGAYWKAMYEGQSVTTPNGVYIRLGGSRVYNLADAFRLFGLESGYSNSFKDTYTVFGKWISKLYPGDLPEFYPFEEVSDLSYLKDLEGRVAAGVAETEVVASVVPSQRSRVGGRPVEINFVFGKYEFAPGANTQLESLRQDLSICRGCSVEVNGHTDNVGSIAANKLLSQQRADAVVAWLRQVAPGNFPAEKVKAQGFGSSKPAYDNSTDDGRAKNRRVEVVLYSAQ